MSAMLPPVNKNDGFIIVSCLSPAQAKAPAHGAGLPRLQKSPSQV